MTISNRDDVIDSRDVEARIDELESERQDLVDNIDMFEPKEDASQEENDEAKAELLDKLAEWDADNADELKALTDLRDEAQGYAPDWRYGATLVRDSYWEDYVREMLNDLGELPKDLPGYIVIDWEKTGDNIKMDYTSVDYDGVEYWVR